MKAIKVIEIQLDIIAHALDSKLFRRRDQLIELISAINTKDIQNITGDTIKNLDHQILLKKITDLYFEMKAPSQYEANEFWRRMRYLGFENATYFFDRKEVTFILKDALKLALDRQIGNKEKGQLVLKYIDKLQWMFVPDNKNDFIDILGWLDWKSPSNELAKEWIMRNYKLNPLFDLLDFFERLHRGIISHSQSTGTKPKLNTYYEAFEIAIKLRHAKEPLNVDSLYKWFCDGVIDVESMKLFMLHADPKVVAATFYQHSFLFEEPFWAKKTSTNDNLSIPKFLRQTMAERALTLFSNPANITADNLKTMARYLPNMKYFILLLNSIRVHKENEIASIINHQIQNPIETLEKYDLSTTWISHENLKSMMREITLFYYPQLVREAKENSRGELIFPDFSPFDFSGVIADLVLNNRFEFLSKSGERFAPSILLKMIALKYIPSSIKKLETWKIAPTLFEPQAELNSIATKLSKDIHSPIGSVSENSINTEVNSWFGDLKVKIGNDTMTSMKAFFSANAKAELLKRNEESLDLMLHRLKEIQKSHLAEVEEYVKNDHVLQDKLSVIHAFNNGTAAKELELFDPSKKQVVHSNSCESALK